MSQKNFASYGDMETLVAEIADKCGPYTEISYEDWLQLTPYQQEHGRWDVTGVPGADGTISIDLMTKLWENPNPNSNFAAQDVSLALTGYDLILTLSRSGVSAITLNDVGKTIYLMEAVATASTELMGRRRLGSVTSTGITFNDAYRAGTSAYASVDNSFCVPITIYGIKLHHTVEIKAIAPTVSTLAENCVFDPTGTDLESTDVEAAIKELEANFQAGVDDIYDAVVAKGSTPASHSLSDVVTGIGNIDVSKFKVTQVTAGGSKYNKQVIFNETGYYLLIGLTLNGLHMIQASNNCKTWPINGSSNIFEFKYNSTNSSVFSWLFVYGFEVTAVNAYVMLRLGEYGNAGPYDVFLVKIKDL